MLYLQVYVGMALATILILALINGLQLRDKPLTMRDFGMSLLWPSTIVYTIGAIISAKKESDAEK